MKHRHRIVNYEYYQPEQICSIGSGSVESAVKQIGIRSMIRLHCENNPQSITLTSGEILKHTPLKTLQ